MSASGIASVELGKGVSLFTILHPGNYYFTGRLASEMMLESRKDGD
ncbi:hypothetical protein ACQZ4Y_29020 [Rhizobium sp. L80/93]|nr:MULTISPECIES: hypothetical protein [unclassified Rhizobium]MBO9100622.1 hypothetical protein [Rhizobium sp. L58/93]MBO9136016.1 hypothetical protein [Rhizobium sp. B209b/85]QXZ99431.1 hypothetical protein J5289_25490 [Rhizobium sp. B230/85]QYA05431.1 hypothetical protein J5278_29525 [Rhizobium sp. B21/90]